MSWTAIENKIKISNKTGRRRIEFVKATKTSFGNHNTNGSKQFNHDATNNEHDHAIKDEISGPIPGLCDPNLVISNLQWNKVLRNAPGLFNHGNTCYLNSTLQCLLHIPAFSQYILQNPGNNNQKAQNNTDNNALSSQRTVFDMYKKLVLEAWSSNTNKAISPRLIVQNIRRIGKHFRPMRQEDAHEFLRLLLDCIHEEILKSKGLSSHANKGNKLIDTTLISRIFGGYLRNELCCSKCNYKSRTYNAFQDLSLDLQGIKSIMESIRTFIKPEILGKGNEWLCEKCKTKVKATKQMSISRGPNVLVLQLKRFSYGDSGGKLNKHVEFPVALDLPLSDDGGGKSANYELCGVVVHHGGSVHSGHYVAYVKAPNKQWLEMNDSDVSKCSLQKVLSAQAYILFYNRTDIKPTIPPEMTTKTPPKVNSAVVPGNAAVKAEGKPVTEIIVVENQPLRCDYDSGTRLKPLCPWMLKPMRFLGNVFWCWKTSWDKKIRGMKSIGNRSVSNIIDENREAAVSKVLSPSPAAAVTSGQSKPLQSTNSNVLTSDEKAQTILRQIINLGKRGRESGTEGHWETAPSALIEGAKMIDAQQRRDARVQGPKEWDQQLDQGRMKKVRGARDDSAFHSTRNAFQEKLESNVHAAKKLKAY